MRHSELLRALESVPGFLQPRAELEQVQAPSEAAAAMLETAFERGDLEGRSVLDLGAGTGRLAIGAALLGAREVLAIEVDPQVAPSLEEAANRLEVRIDLRLQDVAAGLPPAETVLMNPPFGAQRRGADRPFWEGAFSSARCAVYAFALADSRTFIARRALERHAYVQATRPVPWELPRVFPHHRRRRVALAVDLWVIRMENDGDPPGASEVRSPR